MPSYPIQRKLGDGTVHAVGFGAMGISVWYGAIESDEDRFKVNDNELSIIDLLYEG